MDIRWCVRGGAGTVVGLVLASWTGIGVTIAGVSPPRTVAPGDLAIHVFAVANPGPSAVDLALSADVPPGWEHLPLPPSLVLAPGTEETLFLTVVVPRTAEAGSYVVRLRAHDASADAGAEAVASVHVLAVTGVALGVPPEGTGQPGDSVAYELTVVNRGNVLDRFSVDAASAHGWSVEAVPPELALRPGETGTVHVTLSIPSRAAPGRDLVRVTVRSAEGAEARAAWFTTVLPPGPDAIKGTIYSELGMRLAARFGHDLLSGRGLSLLSVSGEGEVLGGEVAILLHLAGPAESVPFRLSRVSGSYDGGWVRAEVGEVGLDLSPLLLPVGATGMRVGVEAAPGCAALVTGWRGDEGRWGARGAWLGTWGELGLAVRETRGADQVRAGTAWITGELSSGLVVHGETGLALAGSYVDVAFLVGLTAEAGGTVDLQAETYAVGPRFPSARADRAGITLAGRMTMDSVGITYAVRWERDNVLDSGPVPTRVYSDATVAVRWSPPGGPLALFATSSARRNQGFGPGPAVDRRDRTLDLAAIIEHSWLRLRVSGRWKWEEDAVTAATYRVAEYGQQFTFTVGETKATLHLLQSVAHRGGSLVAVENEVGFGWHTPSGLTLTLRCATEGGTVGADIPFTFSPATSVTARLEMRWGPGGGGSALYGEIGFEHEFVAAPPFLPALGWIEGLVFVDENENGRPDPGEPGIEGVVLAAGRTQVASGADGRFLFPPLDPGVYAVALDRVPRGFRPQVGLPLEVNVVLAKRAIIDIPCERLGEITGTVYDDGDRSGTREAGEAGLRRVRVVLEREGAPIAEAYTDPGGAFSFPDLSQGTYGVRVDLRSLPDRYELTTPELVGVDVAPGAAVEVSIGVWPRPRPVVVTYEAPAADFTWEPLAPSVGERVAFDGSASRGEIASYEWDLSGDGVFDAEGVRVEWVFPDPGFYLVTLVVTDSRGLTDELGALVVVEP